MTYDERSKYLYNRWKINCECTICKNNEIDSVKNKLKKLDELLLKVSQKNNFELAYRYSLKMLELINNTLLDQDLLFKQKIYYDMYQLLMYQMKIGEANNYLKKYLNLTKIVESENSQNYIKKYEYLSNQILFFKDKNLINVF